jgi:hypothetical protein
VTSYYPTQPGSAFVAQEHSRGVATAVRAANNEGAITYVEYSYPKNMEFPVAKVLNAAGYYVEPTGDNVAVALLRAAIDPVELTQDLRGVYTYNDPRVYPLSSYSYMVVPTDSAYGLNQSKGYTLAKFAYYVVCEGQKPMSDLGYSPLPINLVRAGLAQIDKIPGRVHEDVDIAKCNNPTFSPDGTNTLARNAKNPPECDRKGGPAQCTTGTGGAAQRPTRVNNPSATASAVADPSATPEPGVEDQPGGGGAEFVDGVPVNLEAEEGWQLRHTLMLLAGILLIAAVAGPPLLSSWSGKRAPGKQAGVKGRRRAEP